MILCHFSIRFLLVLICLFATGGAAELDRSGPTIFLGSTIDKVRHNTAIPILVVRADKPAGKG